jgi:hypothetical protein
MGDWPRQYQKKCKDLTGAFVYKLSMLYGSKQEMTEPKEIVFRGGLVVSVTQ